MTSLGAKRNVISLKCLAIKRPVIEVFHAPTSNTIDCCYRTPFTSGNPIGQAVYCLPSLI
jgi:hypothetical protein